MRHGAVVIVLAAAVLTSRAALLSHLPGQATGEDEASLRARADAALSQTSGEIALPGLQASVEVLRDRWGVPHVFAKNTHDLFFAQGFVAAQDRLWQLDLWRRMAQGRLAEIAGPSAVDRDIFARLLKYRGDMDAEWKAYRPDARAIVEAFVAGVNAQVAVATSAPGKLPIEFQLTGSRPEPWAPEVVIGRMAGYVMTRNARTEIQRAKLVRAVGAERASALAGLNPATKLSVPDGLDLADVSDDILALAREVSESVKFPEEIGSNDWVVSGRLSATGKPLLANDPHRSLMLPSLRYTIHLNAPGWNVIGAGEPALPGVAAGHNERIAFGFTIVGIDQQDLYVEELDPANHARYRWKDGWETVRVERERVAVRGQAAREVELRFTRHGPVVHVDEARHRAYALRWVGAEPGAAGYLRSLALNTAGDWNQFRAAVAGWKVPSENLVYADVDGNIGWIAAGLAPIRKNWDGLLPVPGAEGKYEWGGFLGVERLPQLYNPASGFIATANHNILPDGYPHVLGFEFSAPLRFARILDVLEAGRAAAHRFTVEDFQRLQHDERSIVAAAVASALGRSLELRGPGAFGSTGDPAAAAEAARLIASWDGTLSKSSASAALYETWLPRLTGELAQRLLSPADRTAAPSAFTAERLLRLLIGAGLVPASASLDAWVDGTRRTGATDQLRTPPPAVGQRPSLVGGVGPRSSLADVLISTLTGPTLVEAWTELEGRLGPPVGWEWGKMHRAFFEHPLATSAARQSVLNAGDAARGGDSTTPNATGAAARQTAGASFREVIDVSDWDRSMTINVPGLSGQAGSPHYADLLPLWAEGRYHPLPFSRAAVEAAATERLRLVPVASR